MTKHKTNKSADARQYIDFIDEPYLNHQLQGPHPESRQVREVISRALEKKPLTVEETAILVRTTKPELVEEIFAAARTLKQTVYGNRIVLFAPLYIGNYCVNDCQYCGFRRSNPDAVRRTLSQQEVVNQVKALEDKGHKRLILVFGEHPVYGAQFIADTVRNVYATQSGHGEIRRVNINAAPLDVDDYKIVKAAGIGTYQVFQETYHRGAYADYHPKNTPKGDYHYRLHGLSRAFEAGIDDMGIGVLFGLYDWRFEVLALVKHALFLQDVYGVGPHTVSFPRLKEASGVSMDDRYLVSDDEFKRIIAILRKQNYRLLALFSLSLDFKEDSPYNNLKKIRNRITHSFLNVAMDFSLSNPDEVYEISEDLLIEHINSLFIVVKSAIIYTIITIRLDSKKENNALSMTATMQSDIYK